MPEKEGLPGLFLPGYSRDFYFLLALLVVGFIVGPLGQEHAWWLGTA